MKKIEVYTINNCAYCDAAKALLSDHDLPFTEFNIANDDAKRIELVERTQHRTMPQIFIDDEFIGGYKELNQYLKQSFGK